MESIIFCQAPLKIPAVLNCYHHELNSKHCSVTIVVRNTETAFKFIKSLKLDAQVLFFQDQNFAFPYKKSKKSVKENLRNLNLKDIETLRVFFTDVCDDPTMGCYLAALKGAKIFKIQSKLDLFLDKELINGRRKIPFILRVKEYLMTLMIGYRYRYAKIDHWTPALNLKKNQISLLDYSDMDICKKYQYNIPIGNDKPRVLFLTEPYRNKYQLKDDYDSLNVSIVKSLQEKGFSVGVKGHPRIGCHKDVIKLADFEIPSYIPAEFINLNDFVFSIGFVSSSLCSASTQITAYSVLPMCNIINQVEADYWYDYLNRLSENKVIFIRQFSDIKEIQ